MNDDFDSRAKKLKVLFENDLSKIDLTKLTTKEIHHLMIADYVIVELNLLKVINHLGVPNDKNRLLKKNLFCSELNNRTIRLIEFIESGNKVVPPIIEIINENNVSIRDGFHRMGLFHFLSYEAIPFLVPANSLELIKSLK